jgi:hypothetical protein
MNPPTAAEPTPANNASVLRPEETVICEIKRHPIGILGIYTVAGGLLIILAVLIVAAGPAVFSNSSRSQVLLAGLLIWLVAAVISAGFLMIAKKVYWGNTWTVTDEAITQVKRISLFDRQTSQLSFGNLEDVTAEQDGMFQQIFHYGSLSAETAAATDKFTFNYCPNPSYYVKTILEAREHFEQTRRGAVEPEAPTTGTDLPVPG